jgi:hypothetical protein
VTELEQVRSVDAQISYLAPGSHINRRFVAPGAEANTGTYKLHPVRINDGRPIKDRFSLDIHGFVLARHQSAVADFFNREQVDNIYPQEVTDVVKQLTGANHVVSRGWMVRTAGDLSKHQREVVGYTHQGGVQPPASDAHVDFTPGTAKAIAKATYEQSFPDEKPYSRFIASSLWRTFSPPPQDWPLGLCDGRTVGPDEGTPNALIIVDELPDRETMLGDLPEEKTAITAAVFHHNPNHRWWYFSNMNRDEVVLLKFHDSEETKACRVPHTAFHDPSYPDANPRESIEVRTIAYFL